MSPAASRSAGTILVADDEYVTARAIVLVLEREGYATHVAANGAEALAKLRNGLRVDVLVTDDEIRGAVRSLTLALKVIVEPTGAVAAAAALAGRLPLPVGARVGVILSGGNIDPALLIEILSGRETPG